MIHLYSTAPVYVSRAPVASIFREALFDTEVFLTVSSKRYEYIKLHGVIFSNLVIFQYTMV
jgi:hypothetical protein